MVIPLKSYNKKTSVQTVQTILVKSIIYLASKINLFCSPLQQQTNRWYMGLWKNSNAFKQEVVVTHVDWVQKRWFPGKPLWLKNTCLTLSSTSNVEGKFSAKNRTISSFWLNTAICKLHRLRLFFAMANITHSLSRSCSMSSTWLRSPKRMALWSRSRFSLNNY